MQNIVHLSLLPVRLGSGDIPHVLPGPEIVFRQVHQKSSANFGKSSANFHKTSM
jgi:hypothetical protein